MYELTTTKVRNKDTFLLAPPSETTLRLLYCPSNENIVDGSKEFSPNRKLLKLDEIENKMLSSLQLCNRASDFANGSQA